MNALTQLNLGRLLEEAARQTEFRIRKSTSFSLETLRSFQQQAREGEQIRGLGSIEAITPDSVIRGLIPIFRKLLHEYINSDTGHIGNGSVSIVPGRMVFSLAEYIQILVRATALSSGERVMKLLSGWIQGRPGHFKIKFRVRGISVEETLTLVDGVTVTCQPSGPDPSFIEYSESMGLHFFGASHSLGGVFMTFDCEFSPVLYPPPQKNWSHVETKLYLFKGKIQCTDRVDHNFAEALSLVSGSCVRSLQGWCHIGEFRNFFCVPDSGENMTWQTQYAWKDSSGLTIPVTQLTRQKLEETGRLFVRLDGLRKLTTLSAKEKLAVKSLNISISRWMNSKDTATPFADRFIELRIALEALYLGEKDGKGELRFRLAYRGAWHLGRNSEERKRHYERLKNLYSRASEVIHGEEIKEIETSQKLLSDVQELCRQGILKRLRGNLVPNWDDITLDGGGGD